MQLTYSQAKQMIQDHGREDTDSIILEINSQPAWITEKLEIYDIQSVNQGGCASGSYMPAVTYHQAMETMGVHGDDVMEYIEDTLGQLPEIPNGTSWSGLAVIYLSLAVELWCQQFDLDIAC